MSGLEIAATILGLVNVLLIVCRSIWNYPFGLLMVVLYGFVFLEAKLYADMLLQGFFLVVQAYGWWYWARGMSMNDRIMPETLTGPQLGASVVAAAGLGAVIGTVTATLTDAALPFWDAAVAGGSVVAQALLSRRKLESWYFWIAVDLLAIGLFATRGLILTAALYGVFLGMAVWGLIDWSRVVVGAARAD